MSFGQNSFSKPVSFIPKTNAFSGSVFAAQTKFMSSKVFVGNLSWSASEDELRDTFKAAGTILNVKIATDRETGRAKGFAFIEFEDEKAAMNAINTLNGRDFLGRDLRVSKANPPRARGEGGFGQGFGQGKNE